MKRNISAIIAISFAVSACGSIDNKRALGDFDYVENEPANALVVPENLTPPPERDEFDISYDVNLNGPTGENVDVRAPSLVLPLAESSRIDDNSDFATIWFDQVHDDVELKSFIIGALKEQVIADGVELNETDTSNSIFESSWYENLQENGFWVFTTESVVSQARFRYQVIAKPHGRSVSLTVELIEYLDEDGEAQQMDLIDQQRAEMSMLNSVVAQVDYEYRMIQREKIKERENQKIVSISLNEVNEPAYLVASNVDNLWQNLPYFFESHGFTVTDKNSSKLIYYVNFEKPDNSLWAVIWGDDVPVIDVADEKYQFVLFAVDDETILTIYNSDGEPVPSETLERILPVMVSGLTFDDALL